MSRLELESCDFVPCSLRGCLELAVQDAISEIQFCPEHEERLRQKYGDRSETKNQAETDAEDHGSKILQTYAEMSVGRRPVETDTAETLSENDEDIYDVDRTTKHVRFAEPELETPQSSAHTSLDETVKPATERTPVRLEEKRRVDTESRVSQETSLKTGPQDKISDSSALLIEEQIGIRARPEKPSSSYNDTYSPILQETNPFNLLLPLGGSKCRIKDCEFYGYAKGLCSKHYRELVGVSDPKGRHQPRDVTTGSVSLDSAQINSDPFPMSSRDMHSYPSSKPEYSEPVNKPIWESEFENYPQRRLPEGISMDRQIEDTRRYPPTDMFRQSQDEGRYDLERRSEQPQRTNNFLSNSPIYNPANATASRDVPCCGDPPSLERGNSLNFNRFNPKTEGRSRCRDRNCDNYGNLVTHGFCNQCFKKSSVREYLTRELNK